MSHARQRAVSSAKKSTPLGVLFGALISAMARTPLSKRLPARFATLFHFGGATPSAMRVFALRALPVLGLLGLVSCSTTPPVPDWQLASHGQMRLALQSYLVGDDRVAALELGRVRVEVAATGQLPLAARVELARCAVQVASLDFSPCVSYARFAQDAGPQERAYATLLAADSVANLASLEATQLPPSYAPVLPLFRRSATPATSASLGSVVDPLSRLIAAGVLLRTGQMGPADMSVALQTASDQGWRRPLLAWLGVALKLAETAGDVAAQGQLRRRIELVGGQ